MHGNETPGCFRGDDHPGPSSGAIIYIQPGCAGGRRKSLTRRIDEFPRSAEERAEKVKRPVVLRAARPITQSACRLRLSARFTCVRVPRLARTHPAAHEPTLRQIFTRATCTIRTGRQESRCELPLSVEGATERERTGGTRCERRLRTTLCSDFPAFGEESMRPPLYIPHRHPRFLSSFSSPQWFYSLTLSPLFFPRLPPLFPGATKNTVRAPREK